jgi:hypothetical protein
VKDAQLFGMNDLPELALDQIEEAGENGVPASSP